MRLITYNTRGSLGMDGLRSTGRIIQTVRALTPDIVCFQEIHCRLPWSGLEDQPARLESGLGRRVVFQTNVRFGRGRYGIAVAFRGELHRMQEHMLPGRREQRGALEVQLRRVGGLSKVTVICTHLGLDADERQDQVEALADIVSGIEGPILLCGDLNEGPDAAAVRRLLDLTGLKDAGGATDQATFVSDNPTQRIDYVLYSPGLMGHRFEVVSSLASDHLPVLVDLL